MSDKELIFRSLEKVERRTRANRLFRELAVGVVLFLLFPIALKIVDLFSPFRGPVIGTLLALWFAALVIYIVLKIRTRGTLADAAASVDRKAALQDELKSAYWFLTRPPADVHSPPWVELQVQRAARRAREIPVEALFPITVPHASYLAGGLVVVLIALNFSPMSLNHNWLMLEAAPAFAFSNEEKDLLAQAQELLRQAESLQPELAERLAEIMANLEAGNITPAEALEQLQALDRELDEGNLDLASIQQGLSEMAQDLQGSPELSDVASAMADMDAKGAAGELKQLGDELQELDQESRERIANSLEQAAQNERPGLEELAQSMREAAEDLKSQDTEGAQEAVSRAANDLESLAQKMQDQALKNEASRQLQSLEESLRQRQDQGSQTEQAAGQQGEEGQAGNSQQGEQGQGAQEGESGGEPVTGEAAQAGMGQEGQGAPPQGQPQEADSSGTGQNPSGMGHAPMELFGMPTQLNVQLEKEELLGLHSDGSKPEEIEEASKQERSKLDYRNIRSELTPAEKDVLNQENIPWIYRNLIKDYFQAIRPRGNE